MSKLYIDIADTPESQMKGLMFVKDMPKDKGMLFSFSRVQPLNFWGENTYLPLDIAFVDRDGIIQKISKISPMSRKSVGSDIPCKYAIEANDGFFAENRIEVGDKMFLDSDYEGRFLTFAGKRRSLDSKKSNARVRDLYAQIMGNKDQVTPNPPDQDDLLPANEPNDDWALPSINGSDLWQYLEDDLEEGPDEILVEPSEEETGIPQEPQQVPDSEFEYPSFSNAFDAMEWAEQNHEVVRISYTTKRGTGITRDVEPHGSFHSDSTGKQILVTFDKTVGNIRAFITQNIKSFAFTGERFDPKFKVV